MAIFLLNNNNDSDDSDDDEDGDSGYDRNYDYDDPRERNSYLAESVQTIIPLFPEETKMTITRQKQVRRD